MTYRLRCMACGAEYPSDPFRLRCDGDHGPSLLRALYPAAQLDVREDLPGLFRFASWLPVERTLAATTRSVTWESEGLARALGLSNLWIGFSGYWPEREAHIESGTFKELEACAVLARGPRRCDRILTLASAGNAGRAFAAVASREGVPVCIVVPERSLPSLWVSRPASRDAFLVSAAGGSDYTDAITLAERIAALDGFEPEGGAANVARRDALGTVFLDAAVTAGVAPDHYFQAVGSGTGAIAAWEASLRLRADGRFGAGGTKLHVSQNAPFTPIVTAWRKRQRQLCRASEPEARRDAARIGADVLSNRRPAYGLAGGLYDALVDTGGEAYAVGNEEASRARALFEEHEGIDICAAAGVAVASLIQALDAGLIPRRDRILLNVTGGGIERLRGERALQPMTPRLSLDPEALDPDRLREEVMRAGLAPPRVTTRRGASAAAS